MKHYNAFLTVWKTLLTLATTYGVLSLADYAKLEAPQTWDAFLLNGTNWIIAALPALIRVVENMRKNWRADGKPLWNWPISISKWVAGGLALCIVFTSFGCVTRPSRVKTTFKEKTAAGDVTEVVHEAVNEAALVAGTRYIGATTKDGDVVTPWDLSVNSDMTVTSPQAQAVADGLKVLLEKTPETIADLESLVSQAVATKIPAATSANDAVPGILEKLKAMVISTLINGFKARIGL